MDVSGQSMLPIAALGALMMPDSVIRVLACAVLLITLVVAVTRWRARHQRADAHAVGGHTVGGHARGGVTTSGRRPGWHGDR